MKFRISLITLLVLSLLACSSSRLLIEKSAETEIYKFNSFAIDPVQIERTNGSSENISNNTKELESRLAAGFESKGYLPTLAIKPEMRIKLKITAMSQTILAMADPTFTGQVHGSNFPLANPRARYSNSDAVVLELSIQGAKYPFYTGACRMPNEDFLRLQRLKIPLSRIEISTNEVNNCVKELLENIPERN